MVLWAVAATVVAACSLLILILYRRQVKKTCRQLAFLREHTTNLRLTGGLPFSEWEELVDGVNAILDQAREGRRTAQREEAALKEAITHLSHDIGRLSPPWTGTSSCCSRARRRRNSSGTAP